MLQVRTFSLLYVLFIFLYIFNVVASSSSRDRYRPIPDLFSIPIVKIFEPDL